MNRNTHRYDCLFFLKKNLLSRILGPTVLQRLYQKTGTPIHSSYALPQLIEYYKQQSHHQQQQQLYHKYIDG